MKQHQKTKSIHFMIDEDTKQALEKAADSLGVSAASLVRACVKEMLRHGGTYFMLPENLRLTIEQTEFNRQKSLASLDELLRRRRINQTTKYRQTHSMPRRSF